jgi:hypothetical protein
MSQTKNPDIQVECPCCGATLTIDAILKKVIAHQPPPKQPSPLADFDRAGALLREQAERREALFRQSAEEMKTKSQLLDRKFQAALDKSKDEPVEKPTRDIDLD